MQYTLFPHFRKRFAEYHQMDERKAAETKTYARKYWGDWLLKGLTEVNEEEFLINMARDYSKDKDKFRKDAAFYFSYAMKMVDVNNDGKVSEKEFEVMGESAGIKKSDRRYMDLYPQREPGYVDLEDYLNCFVEFCCNDDAENIELEKPMHYVCGLLRFQD